MITIIFETHAPTLDNEAQLASGWYDVELSPSGQEKAKELGQRYKSKRLDAIFCSDLQRSYKTAQLAFGDTYPVIQDPRLRECNYGELTRAPKAQMEQYKTHALTTPFPGGESYQDTSARLKDFLQDLLKSYDGQTIMIIGHRATQYGLDEHINHTALGDAVLAPWKWQPGWEYRLTS